MKILLLIPLFLLGCVHPQEQFKAESLRSDRLSCRTMCSKMVKIHNPITGECECYKPRIKRNR